MLINGLSRNLLKLNNNFPTKILLRESFYIGLKLKIVEKFDKNAILEVIKNKLISKGISGKCIAVYFFLGTLHFIFYQALF